ncbi:pancreatic triacylglycerol lipase-like [Pomacea canaliculata]|uniref:pancreatic triacylglycerol lipase-like n=1 Tax=Pomacea canaliculata TaxID=400727 RepID=UPI000D72669C|nr:pancreatic triacylglycerol lipase-like [Pomacea canaliculata]
MNPGGLPLVTVIKLTLIQVLVAQSVYKRSTVCYGDLGCFSNDAPFFSLERPISFLPQSPDVINPTFTLYTRQSPAQGYRLRSGDTTGLARSTFNASRPSKFIVHGFLESFLATWMPDMKDALLRQGDYNVVLVDWGSGSFSLYGQASANGRVVGAMIAQLITFIQNTTGARLEDMHIVGHSLGSHVAGYAGERLKHLGRITGLDPAEPYFQHTDPTVRLDPTDALFVDVIHTDGASFYSTKLGLGMAQACGHVDYYPNGGHDQPGCDKSPITHLEENGLYLGVREIIGCNHARAYHLAIDSINSACPFLAYRCDSEDDFKAGRCLLCSGQGCRHMSLTSDPVKPPIGSSLLKYYLRTADLPHYCRYHYGLSLTLAQPIASQQERGTLYARLTGTSGHTEEVKLTNDNVYFNPGQTYTFVMTSKLPLGDVTSVEVRWDHDSELLNVFSWNVLGLRHPKLYVGRIDITSGETQQTATFCGQGIGVETDQAQVFSGKC